MHILAYLWYPRVTIFCCLSKCRSGSREVHGPWNVLYEINPGHVSLTVISRNSNSMEISSCCNPVAGHQITTKSCTCHDSTAAVPCTKFCSDHVLESMWEGKKIHRSWIRMAELLVNRGQVGFMCMRGVCVSVCVCMAVYTFYFFPYYMLWNIVMVVSWGIGVLALTVFRSSIP